MAPIQKDSDILRQLREHETAIQILTDHDEGYNQRAERMEMALSQLTTQVSDAKSSITANVHNLELTLLAHTQQDDKVQIKMLWGILGTLATCIFSAIGIMVMFWVNSGAPWPIFK